MLLETLDDARLGVIRALNAKSLLAEMVRVSLSFVKSTEYILSDSSSRRFSSVANTSVSFCCTMTDAKACHCDN